MNIAATYIPQDRRQALVSGHAIPEYSEGTVLRADLVGFTPLAELLDLRLGARRGAEALTRLLNQVYTDFIRPVDAYGGSVIGFSGDAILCWFAGDSGATACSCALAIQAAITPWSNSVVPEGVSISLGVKVAVVAGPIRRFLVGDPSMGVLDVLAGQNLTQLAQIEQQLKAGEVLVSEAVALACGDVIDQAEWRPCAGSGGRLARLRALQATDIPAPVLAPAAELAPSDIRPWVHPVVWNRLQTGYGEFLTELRPAVALFMGFQGIDYDRDPDAGAKLDSYIRWVQRILQQYDGTLVQLTIDDKGSYLYAAFGAPVANEDDLWRACRAAIELRDPPIELAVTGARIGMCQGTMRTGSYGGETRRTYGVLGDGVNIAARLMQRAEPGQALALSTIRTDTSSDFIWDEDVSIALKGKRELVRACSLIAERKQIAARATSREALPELIGRSEELATLRQSLALAAAGHGRIVGISGEAGIGKSRLIAEFTRWAQDNQNRVYAGECPSYGSSMSYQVWSSIWHEFFGLDASSSLEAQRLQLEAAIAAIDADLLPRLPLLNAVLNLAMPQSELTQALEGKVRKESLEALLVDCLRLRASGPAPLMIMILEDLHWIDPLSHDLLDRVGRVIAELPILIVLAYRSEAVPVAGLRPIMRHPYAQEIQLRPLSRDETSRLIEQRMAQKNRQAGIVSAHLIGIILEKAQGNPFYTEEILYYLSDQGLDIAATQTWQTGELPPSLHRLILSRIDQLAENQQSTLKVASISGRLFFARWLWEYYPRLGGQWQVQADLSDLDRRAFIERILAEQEPQYGFKHGIIHEVTYETLAYELRAQLHEQFAAYLESSDSPERPSVDVLAFHYERSNNLSKKREYLRKAGEAAQAAFANIAARTYYERLASLIDDAAEKSAILRKLGDVLGVLGEWQEAEASYQEALRLAISAEDSAGQARCMFAMGTLCRKRGDHRSAEEWLMRSMERWERLGDARMLSKAMLELGTLAYLQGDYTQATPWLEKGAAIAEQHSYLDVLIFLLNSLGNIDHALGHYQTALGHYTRSMHLCQDTGDMLQLATVIGNMGIAHLALGQMQAAHERNNESLALQKKIGNKADIALRLDSTGVILATEGKRLEALEICREALKLRRELGDQPGISASLGHIGAMAYELNDYPAARAYLEEGVEIARALKLKRHILQSLPFLGKVLYAMGEKEQGRAVLEESLAQSRELKLLPFVSYILTHLSIIALDQADLNRARTLLEESLTMAESSGEKLLIAYALTMAAQLACRYDPQYPRSPELARLLAAIDGFLLDSGSALESVVRRAFDDVLSQVKDGFGEERFAALREDVRSTPLEQSVRPMLDLLGSL